MSTATKSRRRQPRYSVSRPKEVCVEFEHPSPNGRHFRLPVVNLSSSGISFLVGAQDDFPEPEEGSTIPRAVVRVGECMINGDMLIMHTTPGSGSGYVCGALLYPNSDDDLVKLKSVIAGMEASGSS